MSKFFIYMILLSSPMILLASDQLITDKQLLEQINRKIINIGTDQLKQQLENNPMTVLIDVRTEEEIVLRGGTIDAPLNAIIPRGWLEMRIAEYALDKDIPIVVY